MQKFTKEFSSFLREYKIISLAVAFVMGGASTSIVNSLVKDVFMPMIGPLFATESWRSAVAHIGSTQIAYGSFLAELINFLILALVVFIVVHKIIKRERTIEFPKGK